MEKVNRKDALLEEKSRYEALLDTYKEVLNDTAQQYRELQNKEVIHLAEAIAVALYSKNTQDSQKDTISNLLSTIDKTNEKQTL